MLSPRKRAAGAKTAEEIAYRMLWSGKAYSPEEARAARMAKARYAMAA